MNFSIGTMLVGKDNTSQLSSQRLYSLFLNDLGAQSLRRGCGNVQGVCRGQGVQVSTGAEFHRGCHRGCTVSALRCRGCAGGVQGALYVVVYGTGQSV
jgi:hypothetical protein